MGEAQAPNPNPVIHRTKLFKGQAVEEVYFDVVFVNKRCTRCRSAKPCIRVQTFVAIADIPNPAVRAATFEAVAKGKIAKVETVNGVGVRTGEIFACAHCRKDAEVAAARGPSYAVVVIDRLPNPDRPLVSVA